MRVSNPDGRAERLIYESSMAGKRCAVFAEPLAASLQITELAEIKKGTGLLLLVPGSRGS